MSVVNATATSSALRRFTQRSKTTKRLSALVGATAATLFSGGRLYAASGTWSGAVDDQWSTAGNWDNIPGATSGISSTDIATFNSNPANVTVTVDANRNISGITFDTMNAGEYTIGGSPLLLSNGGTILINDPVDATETINSDLVFEGPTYTITSNSSINTSLFTFGGAVSYDPAVTGAATLNLNGINPGVIAFTTVFVANAFNGVISNGGASSLNVNMTGSVWSFNATNTYTGTTTVNGPGTFFIAGNDAAAGASKIVLSNTGHLQASTPVTLANNIEIGIGGAGPIDGGGQIDGQQGITVNGSVTFAGGSTLVDNLIGFQQNLTLNGPVFLSNSLTTPRTVILDASGDTVINGLIADATTGVGGSVNLFKTSPGTLTLNGANTGFSGGVTIDDGLVLVGHNSALGIGPVTLAGGQLQGSGGARTIANNLILTGGTIIGGAQDLTFTGSVTNSGGNNTLSAQSLTNLITFSGPIYLSESSSIGRTMFVDGGPNSLVQQVTISGVISNAATGGLAGNLTKVGRGNLILSADNIYTGTTTINFDTVTLGAGGATGKVAGPITIAPGANLAFNHSGTVAMSNVISGAGNLIDNSPIGSFTLLSGTNTYSGKTTVTTGLLEFTKIAAYGSTSAISVGTDGAVGVDTGSNATAFLAKLTASTTNNTGALALAPAPGSPDETLALNFTSGTLANAKLVGMSVGAVSAGVNYTGTITPASSTYRLGGGGVLTLPNANQLSGANAVTITNSGAGVIINGSNNYSGNTNVNSGIFTIGTTGALTASNNLTVAAGATMNVNGSIPVTATVNANGTVNFPGTTGSVAVNRNFAALNIGTAATVTVNASTFPFTPLVLHPTTLSLTDLTSKLNLTYNELLTAGSATQALALINSGQIYSSLLTSNTALGYIDVAAGNMEIRYTLKGDTNLDGKVDVGDLGALATSYGISGGMLWANGDSNRDGNVDVGDLGALATNYGTQLGTGPDAGDGLAAEPLALVASSSNFSAAAVPEPASLGLIALGGIAMSTRRQRRR